MKLSLLKIAGIVGLSVAATLVGVNLMSDDEKEIRRKVEHKYAVADPQFLRTMGALLGPLGPPGPAGGRRAAGPARAASCHLRPWCVQNKPRARIRASYAPGSY